MEFGDEFGGKGVVVTGALGVFGRQIAESFAEAGAKVCITDTDAERCFAFAADLASKHNSDCFGQAADLTCDESMAELISTVGSRWGAVDILVNNAGVYPSGFLLDISHDDWDRIMDINLRAPFVLTRGFALQMIDANRSGAVINISSGAARKMRRTAAPYSLSKTALDRLTKGFAIELAEFGIRVNALEPGFSAGSEVSKLTDEHIAQVTGNIPLGRPATKADVGQAALYLASDAASYVTGATLSVDGGNSIGSMQVFQDKKTPL